MRAANGDTIMKGYAWKALASIVKVLTYSTDLDIASGRAFCAIRGRQRLESNKTVDFFRAEATQRDLPANVVEFAHREKGRWLYVAEGNFPQEALPEMPGYERHVFQVPLSLVGDLLNEAREVGLWSGEFLSLELLWIGFWTRIPAGFVAGRPYFDLASLRSLAQQRGEAARSQEAAHAGAGTPVLVFENGGWTFASPGDADVEGLQVVLPVEDLSGAVAARVMRAEAPRLAAHLLGIMKAQGAIGVGTGSGEPVGILEGEFEMPLEERPLANWIANEI